MKYFILLFVLVACAAPQKSYELRETRCLASVNACKEAVESLDLSEKNVVTLVKSLRKYFESLEATHKVKVKKIKHASDITLTPKDGLNFERINVGAVLYERFEDQERATVGIKRLGFKEKTVKDYGYWGRQNKMSLTVFEPPTDLALFFELAMTELMRAAREGKLKSHEMLWPALVFVHKKTGELKFSRPGVDELPDSGEGWRLAKSGEVKQETYFNAIAQGRVLVVDVVKDFGAILDYMSSPRLMTLHKRYFQRENELKDKSDKPAHESAGVLLSGYLITLKPGLQRELKDFISRNHSKGATKEVRRIDLRAQLENGKLLNRLKALEKDFYKYFEIHGKQALDGLSMYAAAYNHWVHAQEDLLRKDWQTGAAHLSQNIESYVAFRTFWGLWQRMRFIANNLSNGEKLPQDVFYNRHRNYGLAADDIKKFEDELIEGMLEFEDRVEIMSRLELTAEQILEDVLATDYQATATHRAYVAMGLPQLSLEYKLFVLGQIRSE